MRWALVALIAAGLTAPASAQDDDDEEARPDPFEGLYKKAGPYVVGTATYAIAPNLEDEVDRDFDAMFGPTSTDVEDAWGVGGRLGYRVLDRLSLEGHFEWLTRFDVDGDVAMGPDVSSEIGLFAVTGNAKGYLLTEKFQPYVVAGAGWSRARIENSGPGATQREDGFVWRVGGGFEYYARPDVGIVFEASYVSPEGELDDFEYVSIGAGLVLRYFPGGL